MALSDDLRWEKNRYERSLNHVCNTANNLSNSINTLRKVRNIQNACYQVNDVGGGGSYLDRLIEREERIYSNIVNNIIPNVRSRIRNLNWRIDDAVRAESED